MPRKKLDPFTSRRAHAVLRLLHCDAHHERVQECFCPAVRCRLAIHASFGASADDIALRLAQMRQGELGHQERGADIATDMLVENIHGHVVGLGVGEQDARVIRTSSLPYCWMAALIHSRAGSSCETSPVTEIAWPPSCTIALPTSEIGSPGSPLTTILAPSASELSIDSFSNARPATRDNGNFVLKLTFHDFSFKLIECIECCVCRRTIHQLVSQFRYSRSKNANRIESKLFDAARFHLFSNIASPMASPVPQSFFSR